MAELHSYTIELNAGQIQKLKSVLGTHGYSFKNLPYAHFAASKGKTQVAAYISGKCVVQGKGTGDFVEFILEPEVTGAPKLGYEKILNPTMFEGHIGVDESGKGDFFGPLVVAGVYASDRHVEMFQEIGVKDSKSFASDKRIGEVAEAIENTGCALEVIPVSPETYNKLQKKMRSVNEVLGWGHAKVIENLLEKNPSCKRAVCDQFARTEHTIRRYLGERGKSICLEQRHKAESDLVVAAASIIARDRFVKALKKIGSHFSTKIPLGASAQVKALAASLIKSHGKDEVSKYVKTHFKTWAEITGEHLPFEE